MEIKKGNIVRLIDFGDIAKVTYVKIGLPGDVIEGKVIGVVNTERNHSMFGTPTDVAVSMCGETKYERAELMLCRNCKDRIKCPKHRLWNRRQPACDDFLCDPKTIKTHTVF